MVKEPREAMEGDRGLSGTRDALNQDRGIGVNGDGTELLGGNEG
jgi:hypothetical protein